MPGVEKYILKVKKKLTSNELEERKVKLNEKLNKTPQNRSNFREQICEIENLFRMIRFNIL